MPPVRCCIIVPMNARIANPAVIVVVLALFTHFPALRPSGDISTMNARMCIHRYGKYPIGVFMKFEVSGFIAYPTSNSMFRMTTGNHFLRTRKPKDTATTKAGRKSRPKNGAGVPNPIAAKVPMIMLVPPMYGPRRIPKRGANMSERWNVAPVPIMGTVGMILKAA